MAPTCSKEYLDFPFAHRQPNHSGHCRFVHGHNWSFHFTFKATELDECGFVVDFGGLKWLKEWLEEKFDHTTVLNANDPHRVYFESNAVNKDPINGSLCLYDLRWVPDCSCEGLAAYVFSQVNSQLLTRTDGRVSLAKVVVYEDSKNSAAVKAE